MVKSSGQDAPRYQQDSSKATSVGADRQPRQTPDGALDEEPPELEFLLSPTKSRADFAHAGLHGPQVQRQQAEARKQFLQAGLTNVSTLF